MKHQIAQHVDIVTLTTKPTAVTCRPFLTNYWPPLVRATHKKKTEEKTASSRGWNYFTELNQTQDVDCCNFVHNI